MTTLTYILLALVLVAAFAVKAAVIVVIWRFNIEGWRAAWKAWKAATLTQRWLLVGFMTVFMTVAVVAGIFLAGRSQMQ